MDLAWPFGLKGDVRIARACKDAVRVHVMRRSRRHFVTVFHAQTLRLNSSGMAAPTKTENSLVFSMLESIRAERREWIAPHDSGRLHESVLNVPEQILGSINQRLGLSFVDRLSVELGVLEHCDHL
jgi:hypothetical protein